MNAPRSFWYQHGLGWAMLFVLLVSLGLPGHVSAHVGIFPSSVPTATTQSFTIRVPTEKDVATTEVRIEFPTNLTVSRFQPKPGWQRRIERDSAGRIAAATWSGGTIGADEYEEFVFLGRTPREPEVLTFKTYQTYADGETVAWADNPEADLPAPTVAVVASAAGSAADASAEAVQTPLAAPPVVAPAQPTTTLPAGEAATTTSAPEALPITPVVGGATAAPRAVSNQSLAVAAGALGVAVLALVLAATAVFRRPPS